MRDPWVIASLLAIAVVVVATPVVLFAMVVAQFSNSLSHIGERKHLKPVPISASACPYVALMHAAANNYQNNVPLFGIDIDEHGRLVPWSRERPKIDASLQLLEGSIKAGTPHFPHPIRAQLAVTLGAVHDGRVQLARSSDEGDLFTRTQPALTRGQRAFGFASDLVGRQCRVRLGADPSAAVVSLSGTTTVPVPGK